MEASDRNSQLVALDFAEELAALEAGFVRRTVFENELEAWLAGSKPTFLLIGEPGSGKSAIAASIVLKRKLRSIYHFCIHGRASTLVPGIAWRSFAAQLYRLFPEYGEALANSIAPHLLKVEGRVTVGEMNGGSAIGVLIKHFHAPNPIEEFYLLIAQPLSRLSMGANEILLIVVDGLDEAVQGLIPELIAKRMDLPSWVRLVCTTRHDRRVLSLFDQKMTHFAFLNPSSAFGDVKNYIENQIRANVVSCAEGLVERLASTANGNFLVAQALMMGDGDEALRHEGSDMAETLFGIYSSHLRRFSDEAWEKYLQPVLGVLSVAQEPLTEGQLSQFTGIDISTVRRQLGTIQQFLFIHDHKMGMAHGRTFRIYHEAFRDFLSDLARNLDYLCLPVDQHKKIVSSFPLEHSWAAEDLYYWRHYIKHCCYSGQSVESTCQILANASWLRKKLRITSVDAAVEDFSLISQRAPSVALIAEALNLSRTALSDSLDQLVGQVIGRLAQSSEKVVDSFIERLALTEVGEWIRPRNRCLLPLGGPLRHSVSLGPGSIEALALSTLGNIVLVAIKTDICAVDLQRGKLLYKLSGHQQDVYSVAIDDAANYGASTAADGTIRIWNLKTRCLFKTIMCRPDQNADIVICAGIVITRDADRIAGWEVHSGVEVPLPYQGHAWERIIARGTMVLADTFLSHAQLWDAHNPSNYSITSMIHYKSADITPAADFAVSIGEGPISTWNLGSGKNLLSWEGHSWDDKTYYWVGFIRGGQQVVSMSGAYEEESPEIRVWDSATGTRLQSVRGHHTMVTAIQTDGGNALFATGTIDGDLRIWDLDRVTVESGKSHNDQVRHLSFVCDGSNLLSSASSSVVVHAMDGSWLGALSVPSHWTNTGFFETKIGTFFAFSCGMVEHRRGPLFEHLVTAWRVGDECKGICAVDDGEAFLSLTNNSLSKWSASGELVWCLELGRSVASTPTCVAAGPGGKVALVGYGAENRAMSDDWEHPAILIDLESRDVIKVESIRGTRGVRSASSLGLDLFMHCRRHSVHIWAIGGEAHGEIVHPGEVTVACAAPDGSRILSGCTDGVVRVTSWPGAKLVCEFKLETSITSGAISDDGCSLAIGDYDGRVHGFRVEVGGLTVVQ